MNVYWFFWIFATLTIFMDLFLDPSLDEFKLFFLWTSHKVSSIREWACDV